MTGHGPRELSARDAAAQLAPRDTLAVPLGPGQPGAFLHALGEREDFEELTVFSALLMDAYRLFTRPGVRLLTGFLGPVERALRADGHRVEALVSDFRGFAQIARELCPRVMATAVAPDDGSGHYSLSLHAGATVAELRRCGADPERLLIAEVVPGLPRTRGLPPDHPHALRRDEIDVLVHSDRGPWLLEEPPPGELERAIARHALAFVRDGATLQTGIGGVPNALAALLASGPGGDYGIHSEMFTAGLMQLHRAGKVTNKHKGVFDGVSVATFALGSQELCRWLDGRGDVAFLPVEVVNDPAVIARNASFVSINGALAVDLFGQVVADTLGGEQFSGVGGHEDFVAGAVQSAGGRSLLCLPSTAGAGEARTSRIVAALAPGTLVTTPRHHVDVIVTEHGAAELRGRTTAERARALLTIAHPDFREQIAREGAGLGLPVLDTRGQRA